MICTKCGNSGVLITGEKCDCDYATRPMDTSIECLTIPVQYRNMRFDKNLIRDVTGDGAYQNYMQKTFDDLSRLKNDCMNIFLSSPAKTSKTVLTYCVLQALFRKNIPTFPLFDVLEINQILKDVDHGKECFLLEGFDANPMNIYKAPLLFVKIPNILDYAIFDTMVLLMERRTRRNNSTVFIYNGSWSYFIKADTYNKVIPYMGDGSYGTLLVRSFSKKEVKIPE